MDLERSLTSDSKKSKLLGNLVATKTDSYLDKNDPANQLNDIIDDITKRKGKNDAIEQESESKEEEDVKCVTCRKLQILEKYGHRTNLRNKQNKNFCRECFEAQKLQHLSQSANFVEEEDEDGDRNKLTMGPLPKGKLGPWTKEEDVELIPQTVIERYRLTLDEIKLIPKFTNYSHGEPTQVMQHYLAYIEIL